MPRIEKTKTECRKRVKDPKKFDKRSFRSKRLSKRTRILVACPKGQYSSKLKRCKVGMQTQSIIKKKNKDGSCPKF